MSLDFSYLCVLLGCRPALKYTSAMYTLVRHGNQSGITSKAMKSIFGMNNMLHQRLSCVKTGSAFAVLQNSTTNVFQLQPLQPLKRQRGMCQFWCNATQTRGGIHTQKYLALSCAMSIAKNISLASMSSKIVHINCLGCIYSCNVMPSSMHSRTCMSLAIIISHGCECDVGCPLSLS